MRIMKLQWTAAICAVIAAELAGPANVEAQVTERTFSGAVSRDWFNRFNWDPDDDYPDNTVHAIIAARCEISDQEAAFAKNITINTNKLLVLLDDAVLVLGRTDEEHNSYIHEGGLLEIGESAFGGANLRIAGDHTITGDGGVIQFQHKFGTIEDNGDADDHLTITGEDIGRDESLVVTGADGAILRISSTGAFCTSGELTHQSVPNGGSGTTPSIVSAQAAQLSVSVCLASTVCP